MEILGLGLESKVERSKVLGSGWIARSARISNCSALAITECQQLQAREPFS